MNQQPQTFQSSIQVLESVKTEINLAIGQLNPNCQNLIISINPVGFHPLIFKYICLNQPKRYFINLNEITQIYICPSKQDGKHDLIRHYLFNHIAKLHPKVKIQIVYMIPSNQIDNLYSLLQNDFVKIQNNKGLFIFFYDTQDKDFELDPKKILQLTSVFKGKNHICYSLITDLQNSSRIVYLSNKQIQDEEYLKRFFQYIPGYYKPQEIEQLFQLEPQFITQFQQEFNNIVNRKIQIVFKDINTISNSLPIQQLLKILPELIEFEIILKCKQTVIDQNDKLLKAIQNVYTKLGIYKPNAYFDELTKYLDILTFFNTESFGNIYLLSLQKQEFTSEFYQLIDSIKQQELNQIQEQTQISQDQIVQMLPELPQLSQKFQQLQNQQQQNQQFQNKESNQLETKSAESQTIEQPNQLISKISWKSMLTYSLLTIGIIIIVITIFPVNVSNPIIALIASKLIRPREWLESEDSIRKKVKID